MMVEFDTFDPDIPNVPRQIDVLIEEGGRRTAVECRDRDSARGVMWVEELVGRRISLGLDGISGGAVIEPAIGTI